MKKILSVFVVAFVFVGVVRAADGDPDLTVTPIARDGQVVVSFDLSDGFTPDVRDAIQSGLSTNLFVRSRPVPGLGAVRSYRGLGDDHGDRAVR